MFKSLNSKGTLSILVLLAAIGITGFLIVTSIFNFSDNLFSNIFPKPSSRASELYLPIDLSKCLDIGVLHDRTKYHSLVHFQNSEDPNDPNRGNPICHWDHTHGFNPNNPLIVNKLVNSPAGPVSIGLVGALANGQSISYPWQTFKGAGETHTNPPGNPADLENGFKHNFYTWIVRTDMPCTKIQDDADGCITDFRWQEHADLSYIGAISRFHSFSIDARLCLVNNPSDCGIARMGGWIDYGHLQSPDDIVVNLPGDPTDVNNSQRRLHQPVKINSSEQLELCQDGDTLNGGTCLRNGDVTWYGVTRGPFGDGFNGEGFGPVNPASPSQKLLYSDFGHPERNGSWHKAEILSLWFRSSDDLDGVNDGRINWKGYQDRYGNYRSAGECTSIGLDCIPVEFINIPVAHFIYRESQHNPNLTNETVDLDLTPASIPSWIVYNDTYIPDPTPVPVPSGTYEVYSASLTPVQGTGSSGIGKYTFKLMCSPETTGSYTGKYMVYPNVNSPDTFVSNLLGNPYNAHIHYTSSGAPLRGIITPYDPPPANINPVNWLTELIMPDKVTIAPALTQSERNEIRYQPATGQPGTWVNIHTNACSICQNGELQGDVKKISGECEVSLPSASFSLDKGSNTSFTIGSEIPVKVMVRSDNSFANLFSAKLNFDPTKLEVVRVEYTPTFVTEWAEQFYNNTTGEISIIGGVPTPGFKTSGTDSLMVTIVFKGKEASPLTSINFNSSSGIYKDSDNSNILLSSIGTTLTLSGGAILTPSPSPSVTPVPTQIPASNPSPTSTDQSNLCSISSASWSGESSVSAGTLVTLSVTGAGNCEGKQVQFMVKENDSIFEGSVDEDARIQPLNTIFSGNAANTSWTAEYIPDGFQGVFDPPEYFFNAQVVGEGISVRSQGSLLSVTKLPAGGLGKGDGNLDGRIDIVDLSALFSYYCIISTNCKPNTPSSIDFNDDALINAFDFSQMRLTLIQLGVIRQ